MDEYDDYNLKSEVRYVSYLRILQNRIATETLTIGNSTALSWKNPLEFLKTPFGVSNSFKYYNFSSFFISWAKIFNFWTDMITMRDTHSLSALSTRLLNKPKNISKLILKNTRILISKLNLSQLMLYSTTAI